MTLTTPETIPEPSPESLLQGRFSGRLAFTALVRQGFAVAAAQGWREIIVCDPDFSDWPLGERALVDALNNWARAGRKFTVLANHYAELPRKHARFVNWRKTWGHLIECRASSASPSNTMPSALWSPDWFFERIDIARCVGVAGSEVSRRIALRERLNERLLNSSPAFPATTLGL